MTAASLRQLAHVGAKLPTDHRFSPVYRGPRNPPELGARVEFRAEAARRFWAVAADGSVLGMHETAAEAQRALQGDGVRKVGGV